MDKEESDHGNDNLIPSQLGAFNLPPLGTGTSLEQGPFGHDLSRMPDNLPNNIGHSRAYSAGMDIDMLSIYMDTSVGQSSSLQGSSSANQIAGNMHQRSQSMDRSTTIKPGMRTSDAKLAEIALIDPKRAKKILANRESAARHKKRKTIYIDELEKKVETLSAERDSELKLGLQTAEQHLQGMELHIYLQDEMINELNEEIRLLKLGTGLTTSQQLQRDELHQLLQQSRNVNLRPPSMQKEDYGPSAPSNDQN